MTREEICEVHNLVNLESPDTYISSAKHLLSLMGQKAEDGISPDQGKALLSALFYSLLDANQYVEAALLAWGKIKFNPEPDEVQRLWNIFLNYSKAIVLGAGGLGKTYNGVVFELLDWCRDPAYTNKKIISTAEGHAKSNAWSTLLDFHGTAIVELPGKTGADSIVLKPKMLQAAMQIIAIPQGDDGKGRLQGFHPLPRPNYHPRFGELTRVGAFIDEAEKVPIGLWTGIDNLLTGENEFGSVTIAAVTNPEDTSSPLAQRAEPVNGWDSIDIDEDFEWTSRQGWKVIRLDAAKSENVVQKRQVFPGLTTYEGYMNLVKLGVNHPRYFTFGRGFYPRGNVEYNIVAPGYLGEHSKKIFNFVSQVENIASLDPAFAEGGDEAIMTTGRYGLSDGFIGGERFDPRPCLQIEQQFPMQKGNTLVMADEIMTMLRRLRVRPEYFIMDKTGNALGLYDTLRMKFGDIAGVMWSEESTDRKILQEDSEIASDRYKLIVTEMWFALARWLEYERVKFSPIMDTHKLFGQLTGRKFSPRGKRYRVETKVEYKSHSGGSSPDEADSLIMAVHLIRIRQGERPSIMPDRHPKFSTDWDWLDRQKIDAINDPLPFIPFVD